MPAPARPRRETQKQFYSYLIAEMLANKLDDNVRPTRNNEEVPAPVIEAIPGLVDRTTGRARSGIDTHITPTRSKRRPRDGSISNKSLQGQCIVCKRKTTSLCSTCVDDPECTHKGWICHTNTLRQCFTTHVTNVHPH
jgi:hypothetical protein